MSKKLNESFMQRHKMLLEYSIRDGQAPTGDSYYGGEKRVELTEADPVADPAQGYQKKGDPAALPATDPASAPADGGADAPAASATAPQSPADAMIPDMEGVDTPEGGAPATGDEISMDGEAKNDLDGQGAAADTPDPNESREDILSQLIQLHSDKLKALEEFAMQMNQKASGYEAVVEAMPEVTAQIGQLAAQVKELTPDTPLQAMANVPEELGGTTPEDWWNSYWASKNQSKQLASSPYYPKQKGDMPPQQNGGPVGAAAAPAAGGAPGKEGQGATYYMKASDLPDLTTDQAKNSFQPKTSY